MAESRSRVPCRFFVWGNCHSGLSSPFSHDGSDPTTTTPLESPPKDVRQRRQPDKPDRDRDMETEKDTEKNDFRRTMAGASVRFEEGGRFAQVCQPKDVSAVQLSGLPHEGGHRRGRAVVPGQARLCRARERRPDAVAGQQSLLVLLLSFGPKIRPFPGGSVHLQDPYCGSPAWRIPPVPGPGHACSCLDRPAQRPDRVC